MPNYAKGMNNVFERTEQNLAVASQIGTGSQTIKIT